MIRSYFHIAIQSLRRQPAYALLSILGFALALSGTFIILTHLHFQNNYDKHLPGWERIYRLSGEINLPDNENIHGLLGPLLGPEMNIEMPAIEEVTRLVPFEEKCIITKDELSFFEEQVYFSDSTVFEVFPLTFLHGSPEDALLSMHQMVISEELALKYFGRSDVVGEQLQLNNTDLYTITGVTRDLPGNVHHKLHMLLSLKSLHPQVYANLGRRDSENFWRPFAFHFLLLKENNEASDVEAAFPAFYERHMAQFGDFLQAEFRLLIDPLSDLHFTPQYAYDFPKGSRQYHRLLILAGAFLILIALLNYGNLLSASLSARQRSLGMIRVTGASRGQLYWLLSCEALLIQLASAAIALFLVTAAIPWIDKWLSGSLPGIGAGSGILLKLSGLVGLVLLLSLLVAAGSGAGRRPLELLRGQRTSHPGKSAFLGKSSIVIQFTFAVILVISAILLSRQVQHLLHTDNGFRTDNILMVKLHAEDAPPERIPAFKEELKVLASTGEVAYASNAPGEVLATSHFKVDAGGTEASKIVSLLAIDADYLPLMQMELREGRNFDRSRPNQNQDGVILNEACIDFLGMGDSLAGQHIRHIEILGVLKNARFNSLHEEARPVAFYCETGQRGYMYVELDTPDLQGAMDDIERTYNSMFPGSPFEALFLDETVETMYLSEINQGKLLGLFTLLSIIIANTGLFGLVALLHRRRMREIGIRKVNGASPSLIVALLGRQVLMWVGMAVLLATPLTWLLASRWMQDQSSRIDFSIWSVLLGGAIILLTAVLSTALITFRAAGRNPVDTLRYE